MNNPVPVTKLITDEPQQKVDVSKFYTHDANRSLQQAIARAKKSGRKIVTPLDLALILMRELLQDFPGKTLQVIDALEGMLHSDETEKLELKTGRYTVLSPQLKLVLIRAFLEAEKTGVTEVKGKHLLKALTAVPAYPKLSKTITEILFATEHEHSVRTELNELETAIKRELIGQDEAVNLVVKALKRSATVLKNDNKPIGSFLFLGPTGVGKTQLAKTLAKLFFSGEKSFLKIDMSEYSDKHSTQKFIGAPPGYIGYDQGGQLTNFVRENPASLILFDEIEKAETSVFDIFLQIIDEARLTDSAGQSVSFKDCVLIFTSNIGSKQILSAAANTASSLYTDTKSFYEQTMQPLLLEQFRPEFLNRFENIVMFRPLSAESLQKITRLKLDSIAEVLKKSGIKLVVSAETFNKILSEGSDPRFGARPIERAITSLVTDKAAQVLLDGKEIQGELVV